MRLQELFLIETTEEDRAIISLSSAISDHLTRYENVKGNEVIDVGTIGELFDTPIPILNPVNIQLETYDGIEKRMREEYPDDVAETDDEVVGIWYGHTKTLVVDRAYIGTQTMNSVLTHELRHALDDFKSKFRANDTSRKNSYLTPKKKEHRKTINDPYFGDVKYLAQPAEINARFLEVLNQLVITIRQSNKLAPNKIRPIIMQEFKNMLGHYQIADLFPEKEKSKDYKRLIKRGLDFIEKELAHQTTLK